jgi:hypothetical protein
MKSFYLFLITITICIATSKPAYSSPDEIDTNENNPTSKKSLLQIQIEEDEDALEKINENVRQVFNEITKNF